MDITAISVFGFALIKVVLWLVVIVSAVAIWRRMANQVEQADPKMVDGSERASPVGDVLWSNKWCIGLWMVFFAAAIIYSQVEMGYRPKTVIQPANPLLEEQVREYDKAPTPEIGPAESDLRDAANEGYSERNQEQNEVARDEFMKLMQDADSTQDGE
ncbi:MAG: hypothetical protein OXU73_01500 [Candidatus Campbellbacteria bacterium]|nr:hypothetical protein [Candidatus Campbellbacteria bacterium]